MINLLNFYANRAFPMVFDDSLSMVELIGKMAAKINELIEADNAYFSTDVKTNLKSILTEWQADGTLQIVINEALTSRMDDLETSFTTSRMLYGKKVFVIGDSVAKGTTHPDGSIGSVTWPLAFANKTGANVTNLAIGSTCAAKIGDPGLDPNSGCGMADKLIYDECDYLFIAYGVNDYMHNVPIDKDTPNVNTFKGAYHYMISTFLNRYPTMKIICVTPLHVNNQYVANTVGFNFEDYSTAICEAATKYNVPVIDMTHISSININNYSLNHFDGYHPKEETYQWMGEFIADAFPGESGIPVRPLIFKSNMSVIDTTGCSSSDGVGACMDANQCARFVGSVVSNANPEAVTLHLNDVFFPNYTHIQTVVSNDKVITYCKITPTGNIYFGLGNKQFELAQINFYCGPFDRI